MKPSGIPLDELTPELRKRLGIRSRRTTFDKEAVRRYALRCLATIADLKQADRRRVLEHALKVNKA